MKRTVLFFLASGILISSAIPSGAQNQVTGKEIQKEVKKTQTATKPGAAASVANPAPATTITTPSSVNAANKVTPPPPPAAVPLTCTWDVTDYDFGKNVIHQKPASATFTLTNAGKDPVTITQVQPSCGCTSPKYTKEPVKPGEKGEVVLTYDAKISGYFSKSAQVRLNDGQRYTITIKGEVQKAQPTESEAVK